ncbi:neuronal acetylcholine receptor subunit beta-2-like [Epargyreus clarus]|uniref:neuronal acetylcholine receptor subunit beta-2-like n=1 Tax=Epargyreus clarus TaxID=520877 RepID=UPI003C2FA50B
MTLNGQTVTTLIFLYNLLLACGCPPDRQAATHDEGKLHDDLLCAYHSDFRPVKDHKSSVTVKVRFALKYISFDSLEETFNLHSWVALTWKDEFLTWKPSDYGDIKETQMESHEIWTPRMALFNADASIYQSDSLFTTCLVASDGTVTCVPHVAHSGICRTSLRRWPYDSQNCTMYFGAWMHTGEQINFTFYKNKPVVLDDYQNGPGWTLLKVVNDRLPGAYSCCPNTSFPMLKYTFMLKREAAGPAAVVVIPSIVIVMLTLTSLLLDIKDNTRLILACFSLFGHFLFLTEIGNDIPKHSSDTPIILLFVRDSMIVTLVAILTTLMLMAIRRRVAPPPAWLTTVNRLVSNGPGKYVIFTEFDPSDIIDGKTLTDDSPIDGERSRNTSDWIKLANLFNSFIFVISLIVYIVLLGTYIPVDD